MIDVVLSRAEGTLGVRSLMCYLRILHILHIIHINKIVLYNLLDAGELI